MKVDTSSQDYNLDRKAASRLLKVSMRTLDRYIKSKKLSTQVVNGRIWLDKKEVGVFRSRKERPAIVDNVDMSTSKVTIDVDVDKVDNVDKMRQEIVDSVSTRKKKKSTGGSAYKKLFNELREEVKEKQERLEIANYRVGQLEAQVRNSMPMLEYHKENFERKKREEGLNESLAQSNTIIKKIKNELVLEKFNKKIFVFILLTILALQPLWLLWIYK